MQPTQEQVKEFVLAAHANFDKVKTLLQEEPSLLNERYVDFDETALEAASHMGNRAIAEHLLVNGAPLTVCAAAMLGRIDDVAEFLDKEPYLVHAKGAHGIPLIYHAALSGNTEITDLLLALDGGEGLENALHAAVKFDHVEMTRWLLERGAATNVKDFQGRTPREVAEQNGCSEIAELLVNAIKLRPATVEDIPAIQLIGQRSRQVAYVDSGLVSAVENAKALEGAWSVETLTTSMTNPLNHAIVAVDSARVVGYLSGRYKEPKEEGEVRLYRIYLDPDYWGEQIGYRMWQSYRNAISTDVKRIDVGVIVDNERATHFYQRVGFSIVGIDEEGHHSLQMLL